jgi:hypothetical protein
VEICTKPITIFLREHMPLERGDIVVVTAEVNPFRRM